MLHPLPKLVRACMVCLVLLMALSSTSKANEIYNPTSCEEYLNPQKQAFIKYMLILEEAFVQHNWDAYKYADVVYGPMWEARIQRDESFSPEERAEGTVLYGRYEHQAEGYLADVGRQAEVIREQLSHLRQALLGFDQGCSAWGFQDCLERWHERLKEEIRNLELILKTYLMEHEKFREEIQMSLSETISEHHDFKFRYQDRYLKWEVDFYPKILSLLRNIDALLNVEWPGGTCCLFCTMEDIRYAESSLSKVLVADKLGSKGVMGNVVGQMDLAKAMDEYLERVDDREPVEPVERPEDFDSEESEGEDSEEDTSD